MKNKKTVQLLLCSFCAIVLMLGFQSCNIMQADGTSDTPVITEGSYFYLLERSSTSVIMMDYQMRELKRWNLSQLYNETSLQGITFDGTYMWVSQAGNTDKIFQLDISGDQPEIINSFDAPPSGQGTIRDITWDGTYLWALNSGSSTYATPAQLYKLNPSTGEVLATYDLNTPEPRALTYVGEIKNVYGSGLDPALYFTDTDKDMVYRFRYDRPYLDTLFSTPLPPRGAYTKYAAGLTFDGSNFWLINSSDVADHLYKVTSSGAVLEKYDLPYDDPGPIIWTKADLRIPVPPEILSISPSTGTRNKTMSIIVNGKSFKKSGTATADLGAGITVNSVTVNSTKQLTLNVTIASNAVLGKRSLTINFPNSIAASTTNVFEVVAEDVVPYIWAADQASSMIFEINLNDETVRQFSSTNVTSAGPQGLAYDGTNMWLCASGTDRRIYKLTVDNSSISPAASFAFPVSGGTMRGIVFEENYLWLTLSISSGSSGKIYKINPQNGAVADSLNSPGKEPRGIAFANGVLYCNDTSKDSVYSYNKANASWTPVFKTPQYPGSATSTLFATGMAFDGENFWIANSSGDYDYIYKVSRTGTVLRTIAAPNKGTAQITGIVYISK
jgi:hypothetical protein